MSFRKLLHVVVAVYSMVLLTSCGSDSPGGGTSEFKTISISASASTTRLESDLLTGNTCTNSVSSGGTFSTDSVDVNIVSTAYPGITTALPVAIDSYTIDFIPNASMSTGTPPALSRLSGSSLGQSISAGGSLTIPVAIVPEALKVNLVNNGTIGLCSGTVYAYYALITFQGIEVGTGTRNSIGPISLDVVFADRSK